MHWHPAIDAAIEQVAWRYGADAAAVCRAISDESAPALAAALGIDPARAEERMRAIRRALSVQDDLGAGCRLLTDEVQQELLAAIACL